MVMRVLSESFFTIQHGSFVETKLKDNMLVWEQVELRDWLAGCLDRTLGHEKQEKPWDTRETLFFTNCH